MKNQPSQPAGPASQLGAKVSIRAAARIIGCHQVVARPGSTMTTDPQQTTKIYENQTSKQAQPASQPARQLGAKVSIGAAARPLR